MKSISAAAVFVGSLAGLAVAGEIPADVTRGPVTLAVSPSSEFAVVANRKSDSLALVDLRTWTVRDEVRSGNNPADVVWIDDEHVLVSLLDDGAVAVFERRENRLRQKWSLSVGDAPRGLAIDRHAGRNRAFVAVGGFDEVAVLDLETRKITDRLPMKAIPRYVGIAPNGRWLVTTCTRPGDVVVHDLETLEQLDRQTVFDLAFRMGEPVFLPDSSHCIVGSPMNRTFHVTEQNIRRGWVTNTRLTKMKLPTTEYWEQLQLGLDFRGDGCGDVEAIALSPDAKWLVASCGGTRELVILDRTRIVWPEADPTDEFAHEYRDVPKLYRRLALGGRPVGIDFVDDSTLLVANDFENGVQVVDVDEARITRTIALGGPAEPSLVRRGEMIFHDAELSADSWFSCHTCHPDGHTNGETFDTVNDGNHDTYKLVPSLRGVTHTKPWTWHGWQTSLHAAMKKSVRDTLGSEHVLTDEEAEAIVAYLATLEPPPSPHRNADGSLTEAAERGRTLFRGRAGCKSCHAGEWFTTPSTYDVGLGTDRMFYDGFNPPSLRGLHARRRFLHDGRADSLEELLERHHTPEKLVGESLTAEERSDLIAYLKSL